MNWGRALVGGSLVLIALILKALCDLAEHTANAETVLCVWVALVPSGNAFLIIAKRSAANLQARKCVLAAALLGKPAMSSINVPRTLQAL